MDEDALIDAVRARVGDAALPPAATVEEIADVERELGVPLHPLHRRLLCEVANGGFGPGFGLIGLRGGEYDGHGMSVVECSRGMLADERDGTVPTTPVVVLCEWGCGEWSCLDLVTGTVITASEPCALDTGVPFEAWIALWARGDDVRATMYRVEGANESSRLGTPWHRRSTPGGSEYLVAGDLTG